MPEASKDDLSEGVLSELADAMLLAHGFAATGERRIVLQHLRSLAEAYRVLRSGAIPDELDPAPVFRP